MMTDKEKIVQIAVLKSDLKTDDAIIKKLTAERDSVQKRLDEVIMRAYATQDKLNELTGIYDK